MKTPTVLIVTNHRQLYAYLVQPDGRCQVLEHIDFEHDGQTGVALIDWTNDATCYRQLGADIANILGRYHADSWGLACPPSMAEYLVPCLNSPSRESLAVVRPMEVDDVNVSNVAAVFTSDATAC